MIPSLNILQESNGLIDVRLLLSLVTTLQQEDDRLVTFGVIHTVTRTDINPKLPDAIAAVRVIPKIAGGHAVESAQNSCVGATVAQTVQLLLQGDTTIWCFVLS